ncbi:MAG: phosphoglycerate kinase [Dehalococcoidia bacterium]|nr:MAG: phosphoglycerate kinase [Dehalococcoidia bacterium]
MKKKTIRDIELKDRKVLVRVDFNVPLDIETHEISDDSRIKAAIPTIQYLIDKGCRVILCSHFGRPKGKVVEDMRLAPVAKRLSELLKLPVASTKDCIGIEVEQSVSKLKSGAVLLLENLRFHPEEEQNDPDFARTLAGLADVYVNDAFGTAHRAHASTAGVANYLPAVAGLLMEKEIDFLGKALTDPIHPFAAVTGGAKVSDKLALLENILNKVDYLLIGGGMCCTFLRSQGYGIGQSSVEEDKLHFVKELADKADRAGVQLMLPVDVVVADSFAGDVPFKVVNIGEIPDSSYVMDIGPYTIKAFTDELKKCKTVVWNGPMGVFEYPAFRDGTKAIAQQLAQLDATTILGGGSTAEAVDEFGLADRMSHVSTGGGASLEFLEGKTLPGVAVLQDKEH